MVYLYAYTNHKENLDSLRRAKALFDALQTEGIECELLLNEYRAQLLARDWGLPLATTIETIKDIDAVATVEDIIIIDSPEELDGKVLEYPNYFKKVIYIKDVCSNLTLNGAEIIELNEKNNIFTEVNATKEDKTLFIYGDSDCNKTIIKNLEIFKNKNLDLYWGNYFFVKYEDILAEIFNEIIEPEDYYKAISNYNNIITSNLQIAIEAMANGSNVRYLTLENLDNCTIEVLNKLNIEILNKNINFSNKQKVENSIIHNINKEIVTIIKSYV